MPNNKTSGDLGEKEIIELVLCPNCGKRLMLLPPNYPLYDVQCTGCNSGHKLKQTLVDRNPLFLGLVGKLWTRF